MLETASWDTERYDFIEQLEKNYLSGFYENQKFAYDPANDILAAGSAHAPADMDIAGYDWTKEDWGEFKKELPGEMLTKLSGENIEPEKNWEEGIPPHIWEEMRMYEVVD